MTTATSTALRAQIRTDRGKENAGRLRRDGKLPAVLYGAGKEPLSLSLDAHTFNVTRQHFIGQVVLLELEIEGQGIEKVFIKALQRDPVNDQITHIDLLRTNELKPVALPLRVVQVGIAPEGVRAGGILERNRFEVIAEAVPSKMPRIVEADLTNMPSNSTFTVKDLPKIDGVTFLDDPEMVLFMVRAKAKASKEDQATDAAAAAAAAAAPAAGAAPVAAAAAPAAKGAAKSAAKSAAAPAAKAAAKK